MSRDHLMEIMEGFDTAMLVTEAEAGGLRGRPMAIAEVSADGTLWFATSIASPKVEDIRSDRRVSVTMQSSKRFVSVSGQAELVRDRDRIASLWRDSWRPWFPRGAQDPALVLVRIRVSEAEYWDMEGWSGTRYVFEAVRALVSGERMTGTVAPWHSKIKCDEDQV